MKSLLLNNIMDKSEKCNTYVGSIKCQKYENNIYIFENTTYGTKKEVYVYKIKMI